MASKNQVELTFAGDADQLVKEEARAEQSTKQLAQSVGKSSEDIQAAFDQVGKASRKLSEDVDKSSTSTHAGFDRAGEAADTLDTRAMGAHDAITGLQDSMASAGALAKGDLTNGLLLAGSGLSDLGSGLYNTVIPSIKSAVGALGRFRTALALSGVGLAIAGAALAIWLVKQHNAKKDVSQLTDTLDKQTGAITENTRAYAFNKLQHDGLADAARRLGINLNDLTNAALGHRGALDEVNEVLRRNGAFTATTLEQSQKMGESERKNQVDAIHLRDAISSQNTELGKARVQFSQQREALGETAEAQVAAKEATIGHADSVRTLADAIKAQTDPVFAYIDAQRQVKSAQDAVKEALDKYGKKSPEYKAAVQDLAKAQLEVFSASGDIAASTDQDLLPALQQMKEDGYLSKSAFDSLKSAIDKARAAAKKANGTRIDLDTALAQSKIVDVQRKIKDTKGKTVTITLRYVQKGTGDIHVSGPHGGGTLLIGAAKGEYITGPGPKGKDSVLRMVAPGEYIVPADDVDAAGGKTGFETFLAAMRSGRPVVPSGAVSASAGGPEVLELQLDLGEGIRQVVQVNLRKHDRGMKRRLQAGVTR